MTDGISFGKAGNANLQNFNGVKLDFFNGKSSEKIAQSIFKKYDANNDGVLDESELATLKSNIEDAAKLNSGNDNKLGKNEAKKFIKNNLGPDSKFNRKELLAFLNEISANEDDVVSAKTDVNGRTELVFRPDENGQKFKAYHMSDGKSVIDYDGFVKDNVVTRTDYENGGIKKRTRTKGVVTEELDFNNNDRVMKRIVNNPTLGDKVTDFDYTKDGHCYETTYLPNSNKKDKIIKKDIKSGEELATRKYTYDGDKVIFDTVKKINQGLRTKEPDWNTVIGLKNSVVKMLSVLGIVVDRVVLDEEDKTLFTKWNEAKANKDWDGADQYRNALIAKGLL